MSLVYAVRDSSPACPRTCVVEAMSWRAHLRWWALLQTLFHALATGPPYLATEVESNSLRSRELTLGTSRYQIPRSGLVQRFLWKVPRYGRLMRLNPLQKPISASNASHNNAVGYNAIILSGTVNRSRRRDGGVSASITPTLRRSPANEDWRAQKCTAPKYERV